MPVNLPEGLPAVKTLMQENIFVMTAERAKHQDIRPLEIAIVNLMPTKISTETQLLRLLSNSPLQVIVTLVQMDNHVSQNTPTEHLSMFYRSFDQIKNHHFDGLIITGAPVEHISFEEVDYWDEICQIMDWSKKHVYTTLHICWGAQAGLYHHYGIQKHMLPQKLSGIFKHRALIPESRLLRGFDTEFEAPHSRYTTVYEQDIRAAGLDLMAVLDIAGVYLAASKDRKQVFVTGHSEYDRYTLDDEYRRDLAKGINPSIPYNYYPDDDPSRPPKMAWRAHAHLFFANWLNYYVYQETPYDIQSI
jgi:homoserine O-succinyltransferase